MGAPWEVAACAAGACLDPGSIDSLEWLAARVPGTVADALRDSGLTAEAIDEARIDEQDWWFRTRFEAAPVGDGEEIVLVLDGLATVAEVYLGGVRVLTSIEFILNGTLVYQTPQVEATAINSPDRGAVSFQFDVPLTPLKPGTYVCQVNVIDDAGGSFSFPRLALKINPPAAPAATPAADAPAAPAAAPTL